MEIAFLSLWSSQNTIAVCGCILPFLWHKVAWSAFSFGLQKSTDVFHDSGCDRCNICLDTHNVCFLGGSGSIIYTRNSSILWDLLWEERCEFHQGECHGLLWTGWIWQGMCNWSWMITGPKVHLFCLPTSPCCLFWDESFVALPNLADAGVSSLSLRSLNSHLHIKFWTQLSGLETLLLENRTQT